MLIDAGIGPRTAAKRLNGTGVSITDVRVICLTHLNSDHFRHTWATTLQKLSIRLHCHESRARYVRESLDRPDMEIGGFNGHAFEPIPGVTMTPIRLAHDEHGSHGFLIEGFGTRIGYATDLGRVPRELLDRFCGVDVLAIESNYDPEMEMQSSRPWYLKKRIMGGKGHLSNEQAFHAVRWVFNESHARAMSLPQHIVLLHRSRECNCPKLLRQLFESDRRIAPRLTLAEQHERTEWLRVRDCKPLIGEQLRLAL